MACVVAASSAVPGSVQVAVAVEPVPLSVPEQVQTPSSLNETLPDG